MQTESNLCGALFGALFLAVVLGGCEETTVPPTSQFIEPEPRFTMGSGSVSTLVGRGTFEGFKVKRETNGWEAEVEVEPDLDIAVQTIRFDAGGQSGWHRHPGPVFIQVKTGTMTFYESNDPACTPIIRSAGQGYLDAGEHAHIARNESGAAAENVVVYFAPVGAALRIDAPDPGNPNCPF